MFRSLRCFLIGHDYMLTQRLTKSIYRLWCRRCGRLFVEIDDPEHPEDNVRGPWDSDYHQLCERYGIEVVYQPFERT